MAKSEGPGKPKEPQPAQQPVPAEQPQPAQPAQPTVAVATTKPGKKITTFSELLEWAKPQIGAILPKHITPERMIAVLQLAASKTPKLKECTPMSLFDALIKASRLGLEIGQHSHLVPFFNGRTKKMEAVFIPDYRGLIHLAVGSEKVKHIDARVVYEGDAFDYGFGDQPFVKHKPVLGATQEADKITAFYAVAHLDADLRVFDIMSRAEVDAVMARSRAKDDGPWKTDYAAMGKKTVVKRLCKFLPQTPLLAAAVEADNRAETGEIGTPNPIIDTPEEVNQSIADTTKQQAEDLKAKMAEQKTAAQQAPGEQPATPGETPDAAPSGGEKAKQGDMMF